MRDAEGWPPDLRRMEGDMPFQRRVWRVQRMAWVAMVLVVAAAMAGAFGGDGPLALGRHQEGGATIEWARIQRIGAAAPIRITLPPGDGALRLSPDFLESWRLRAVTPPPLGVQAGPDGYRLEPAGTEAGAVLVLEAEATGWPGLRRLRLRAAGQDFDLPVLVWP
jgi:hypothetical protein